MRRRSIQSKSGCRESRLLRSARARAGRRDHSWCFLRLLFFVKSKTSHRGGNRSFRAIIAALVDVLKSNAEFAMPIRTLELDPERFFPADSNVRRIALRLFSAVEHLPIISPHGHTDPAWFSANAPFEDAVSLLLWPDHYLLRMLMSQGVALEQLGLSPVGGEPVEMHRRAIWRLFSQHYRLFRATPSKLWLDHVFATV